MSAYLARVGRSLRRVWPSSAKWDGTTGLFPAAESSGSVLWFIQTYRDLPKLEVTLHRLRRLYPLAAALVVSDGDPDPAIEPACRRCGVPFESRSRMFGVEHGGLGAHDMLERFLQSSASVLIKIDPDTDLRRPLSRLPPSGERALYGTVQQADGGGLTSIQGGCILIPRAAAQAIVESGLLESDRLKPPACEWAVDPEGRARAAAGLTSYDWTLGWACRELGIPSRDHPEVFSRYQPGLMDTLTVGDAAIGLLFRGVEGGPGWQSTVHCRWRTKNGTACVTIAPATGPSVRRPCGVSCLWRQQCVCDPFVSAGSFFRPRSGSSRSSSRRRSAPGPTRSRAARQPPHPSAISRSRRPSR